MTPRVLGLDLSISATGIAAPDGTTHVLKLHASNGDQRLSIILDAITDQLNQGVDLAVIEDLPTHAQGAGITGMVHGVARWALIDTGTPYALVPPASLKKYATGRGNATKPDMRMALFQRAGIDLRDDNECDAWWLRAMGLDHLGHPPVPMPTTHRAALEKITWPDLELEA